MNFDKILSLSENFLFCHCTYFIEILGGFKDITDKNKKSSIVPRHTARAQQALVLTVQVSNS
jgi:hypothetical protein